MHGENIDPRRSWGFQGWRASHQVLVIRDCAADRARGAPPPRRAPTDHYQYLSVLVMDPVELCFRYPAPHRVAPEIILGEVGMISRSDLDRSFSQLKADAMRLADENDRLRQINAQMLVALQYSLPVLQEGLPETVNFDQIRLAVAKVQGAIAEAERDT